MNSSRHRHPRGFSRLIAALFGCCLALVLSSCSPKANTALYGKWQEDGAKDITEIREDGTFRIGGPGRETMTGKFKFTGSDSIKMELDGPEGKVVGPMACRFVVQGDTLDLTMPDGTKSHNKRVK